MCREDVVTVPPECRHNAIGIRMYDRSKTVTNTLTYHIGAVDSSCKIETTILERNEGATLVCTCRIGKGNAEILQSQCPLLYLSIYLRVPRG
jgi:hypothetical protein